MPQRTVACSIILCIYLAIQLLLREMDEGVKEEATGSTTSSSPQRPSEKHSRSARLELLSSREIDVLRLVMQGQTNKEIAKTLFVSVPTVKKHLQQIFTKLGVSGRTQAVQEAVKLGFHI